MRGLRVEQEVEYLAQAVLVPGEEADVVVGLIEEDWSFWLVPPPRHQSIDQAVIGAGRVPIRDRGPCTGTVGPNPPAG